MDVRIIRSFLNWGWGVPNWPMNEESQVELLEEFTKNLCWDGIISGVDTGEFTLG